MVWGVNIYKFFEVFRDLLVFFYNKVFKRLLIKGRVVYFCFIEDTSVNFVDF